MNAIGRGNDATVPIGLFDELVVLFDEASVVTMQLLIPLDGAELGRREQGCFHKAMRLGVESVASRQKGR